jgi:uncharacterized protein YybS (DUF2232 family)
MTVPDPQSETPPHLPADSPAHSPGDRPPDHPPDRPPDHHPDLQPPRLEAIAPLSLVETAFLASAASLIWLVNYYFPLGPALRIFFPLPIALVYLRWDRRAAWMAALAAGLLLSVLMGPTRSILFVMPYGVMGVLFGWLWRRQAPWRWSIVMGTLLGAIGLFFRIALVSVLLGDDLWLYVTTQVTGFLDWLFVKLGLLIRPDVTVVQILATLGIVLNNLIYVSVVHVVSWTLLERLGTPIPPPPRWVRVILDADD